MPSYFWIGPGGGNYDNPWSFVDPARSGGDITAFGNLFPGEFQSSLDRYNNMVAQTWNDIRAANELQGILDDNDPNNDYQALLTLASNSNVGIEVNGVHLFGQDAINYLRNNNANAQSFINSLDSNTFSQLMSGGTPNGTINNAFTIWMNVYANGMSSVTDFYQNPNATFSMPNGVSFPTVYNSQSGQYVPHGNNITEWRTIAGAYAGINMATWNPDNRYQANQGTVWAVYDFYSRIYLAHPELMWAGMARLAGGSVIGELQTLLAAESFAELLDKIFPLNGEDPALVALKAAEVIALRMQQAIFNDLAWQHEAYIFGGIDALCDAYNRGDIDLTTLQAWYKIASGDQAQILQGNVDLLHREQFVVLQPFYDQLAQFPLYAAGFMSQFATSPMPGGVDFHDFNSLGNLANANDRWNWILNDAVYRWSQMNNNWRAALVSEGLQSLIDKNFVPDPGPGGGSGGGNGGGGEGGGGEGGGGGGGGGGGDLPMY